MKTAEEILKEQRVNISESVRNRCIKAMEEYAKAYANHLAESYSEIEGENKRLCSMYESEKNRLVLRTMERDNWEKQFKEADKRCREMGTKNAECWDKINQLERDLKEYTTLYREYKDRYDYAVIDGTDLRGKLEQQEDRFDQLDGEYQDLVRICTALYRTDKEAIREMINESLGGDNHEKFKNHLGV